MLKLKASIKDLSKLIFPATCVCCEQELSNDEEHICTFCKNDLTFTDFEKYKEATLLDQKFWGRIPLEFTYSLCYFEKDKAIQALIHHLKYKNNFDLGVLIGQMIGERLKKVEAIQSVEAFIPVPLHHRKEFSRSYNQSEALVKGIQKEINIHIDNQFLKKVRHTGSQTKNNRFLRWEKAKEQFEISNKKERRYEHIAIVDDVITTGSTLEAIVTKIKAAYPQTKISVISLAVVR